MFCERIWNGHAGLEFGLDMDARAGRDRSHGPDIPRTQVKVSSQWQSSQTETDNLPPLHYYIYKGLSHSRRSDVFLDNSPLQFKVLAKDIRQGITVVAMHGQAAAPFRPIRGERAHYQKAVLLDCLPCERGITSLIVGLNQKMKNRPILPYVTGGQLRTGEDVANPPVDL